MNKMQALNLMFEGKKVYVRDWENPILYFRIRNNCIVDNLDCDSQQEFNSWKFDNEDIWEEYLDEVCELKVGDKFSIGDYHIYKIIYTNENVVFCECYFYKCSEVINCYMHFDKDYLKSKETKLEICNS